LNPKQIASSARTAQGGPFIPWSQADIAEDEALSALAQSFARLNALEQGLAAIPSGRPTASPMLTSSYGYRRDPFNGRAAFHAGLDFPGSYGQPILAAAPGRVVYVGQRQGYGNVVEVDHGHGILTRYAHLSRFGVRPGALVQRGDAIARMGSTGRSTGTHLHFEVRVNGNAINPARFLEVRQDVLQVQQIAKQRIARVRSADEVRNVG
jgi:murein DD-endopeptidase MepM/ murein hydrolase activator NlpD